MTHRWAMLICIPLLAGCMSARHHADALPRATETKTTAGLVEKEIRKGMSGSDVAAILGSPNIVTKDSDGKETWIYDKMSTETAYSRDQGGVNVLILAYDKNSGAEIRSQRTLTVIIKFKEGKVDDFSYHASSF